MRDIKELNLEELQACLQEWKEPSFHAKQIFSWIYQKGTCSFNAMSDLPADLRSKLKDNFLLFSSQLVKTLKSKDGTEKFLFQLSDKNFIEAVIIPSAKRITGCISTQAGCKFGCSFCASGLSGFKRNLTCAEIIEEALYLKNNSKGPKLTHLVFMGIGEPLDNYDNVLKAIKIINSVYAFNIGARKITISTCGLVPAIKRLAGENLQIELSISLHASDNRTRSKIIPLNKTYPLARLMESCKEYIDKTNRQITFEYILIKELNSDLQNAQNLVRILKSLRLCKLNLILCNPVKELKVCPPGEREILAFKNYLLKSGIPVTLRKPRGKDIEASCGQLRLKIQNSNIKNQNDRAKIKNF